MKWQYESGSHNIARVQNASFDEVLSIAKDRVAGSAVLRYWAQEIFNFTGRGEAQMEWLRFVATALDSEIISHV